MLAPAFSFARRWSETTEAKVWKKRRFLDIYHYAEKRKLKLGYQLLEDALRFEEFPDFKQPALIFHGLHDDVVPPQLSTKFARSHANARLRLLNSDHELLNALDSIWLDVDPFLLG